VEWWRRYSDWYWLKLGDDVMPERDGTAFRNLYLAFHYLKLPFHHLKLSLHHLAMPFRHQ